MVTDRERAVADACDQTGRCYMAGCGREAHLRATHPRVGDVLACSEQCKREIECPYDADDTTGLMHWYGQTSSYPEME